jgi:hypothetical protein
VLLPVWRHLLGLAVAAQDNSPLPLHLSCQRAIEASPPLAAGAGEGI